MDLLQRQGTATRGQEDILQQMQKERERNRDLMNIKDQELREMQDSLVQLRKEHSEAKFKCIDLESQVTQLKATIERLNASGGGGGGYFSGAKSALTTPGGSDNQQVQQLQARLQNSDNLNRELERAVEVMKQQITRERNDRAAEVQEFERERQQVSQDYQKFQMFADQYNQIVKQRDELYHKNARAQQMMEQQMEPMRRELQAMRKEQNELRAVAEEAKNSKYKLALNSAAEIETLRAHIRRLSNSGVTGMLNQASRAFGFG